MNSHIVESLEVRRLLSAAMPDLLAADPTPAIDQPLVLSAAPAQVALDQAVTAAAPLTAQIKQPSPNPSDQPPATLSITFSEAVTGFDLADLNLTRDGGTNLLTNNQSLSTTDNIHFNLIGLSPLTTQAGDYMLTLNAASSGIQAASGAPLSADAATTFTLTGTTLADTSGNDLYYLQTNGPTLELYAGASATGSPIYSIDLSRITRLTINAGAGDDQLIVASALPFTPIFNGGTGIDTLDIRAGSYVFNDDAAVATSKLKLLASGGSTLIFKASQNLASLHLADTAMAILARGGARVLRVGTLSVDSTATLDLTDNDLIIQPELAPDPPGTGMPTRTTVLEQVGKLISTGSSAPTRTGIISSATSSASQMVLGTVLNNDGQNGPVLSSFDGFDVNANSILMRRVTVGDADLNGVVDASDYFRIDRGFLSQSAANSLKGYQNGDFDYNGKIDASDYFLIDKAFLTSHAKTPVPSGVRTLASDTADNLSKYGYTSGVSASSTRYGSGGIKITTDGAPKSFYQEKLWEPVDISGTDVRIRINYDVPDSTLNRSPSGAIALKLYSNNSRTQVATRMLYSGAKSPGWHQVDVWGNDSADPNPTNRWSVAGGFDPTKVTGYSIQVQGDAGSTIIFDSLQIYGSTELPTFIFTFDDGWLDQMKAAAYLDKYGYKGAFGVVTSFVENKNPSFMSLAQLQDLEARGHMIISHSWSHQHLSDLPPDQQRAEVEKARDWLASHGFTRGANIFEVPYGDCGDQQTVDMIYESYHSILMTSAQTPILSPPYEGTPMSSPPLQTAMITRELVDDRNTTGAVDTAIRNDNLEVMFWHYFKEYSGGSTSSTYAQFQQVVDYIAQKEAQGLCRVVSLDQYLKDHPSPM